MPEAAGEVVASTVQGSPRSSFNQHHFVGGNAFMLNLLKHHIEELGLTASTANLNATITRAAAQVQELAGEVTIEEAALQGETLAFTVLVQNGAGHKFPTGFPSRQVWLHVRVTDASGVVMFESGQPQDGRIAGNDADEDLTAFEPHYDLITEPGQVQIYQSVMGDTQGAVTYTLLHGATYLKDNRLLPEGFEKDAAIPDTAVVGAALEDDNFTGGSDQVTYQVDVAGGSGPFTVTVQLLYHPAADAFVRDMREDDTESVTAFGEMYDSVSKAPVLAGIAVQTVE
jgi:hypothetical protein